MFLARGFSRTAAVAALMGLVSAGVGAAAQGPRQQMATDAASELEQVPLPQPALQALPLAEDRGAADLEQTLKRLGTTASVLYIVAHPDDEDGALLTYLSRGLGARCTLFTLTRGEGGQNVMSADVNDALGLIRTNELLAADAYYGVQQLWGTEADFGFSKTQEEAFKQWTHERVLYDAVLAVRRERPQVIVATFVGGVSDGHGQHQVSGEIAQEVFKAAGDPKVFPDQFKLGVQPWQPLAVYSRVPFARVSAKGIFDYATGKWAPARFKNYVTGAWSEGAPQADVRLPVGTWDTALGRSYVQIARQGWGMQKSQNGGANPTLSGPAESSYHLWAVAPAAAKAGAPGDASLFRNDKVDVDTSLTGLARLAGDAPPAWLTAGLQQIAEGLKTVQADCPCKDGEAAARSLAPAYRATLDLYTKVQASTLSAEAKAGLELELGAKIGEFQRALRDLLGLDMAAFTTRTSDFGAGPFPGGSADETARSVTPGEAFKVRVHTAHASAAVRLSQVWLVSKSGSPWPVEDASGEGDPAAPANDRIFRVQAARDAQPTQAYFTRPNLEQPYYDISKPAWRERSFAPWPLAAWAEFTFEGLPIRMGMVVQTMQRVTGPGGIYEPLVVTPEIGVRMEPQARILPLDGSSLPVRVTVHAQAAAEGTVKLKLPAGWSAEPVETSFKLERGGNTEPIVFQVTPADGAAHGSSGIYKIDAVVESDGHSYSSGWQSVGYDGLRPYNMYQPAELRTRRVDVKVAPGLRVGYVMGPGDEVPEAIRELGVTPQMVSDATLAAGDFSAYNVLVIGIRAYSTRPALAAAEPQLEKFVERGGTVVVQYQSANFPAPLPLAMGNIPERVIDETDRVKLLAPENPLLTWPNRITPSDFDGWVEERGHSFLDHWDAGYTALTETADPGQDPQRGGLLVAHRGTGTYIYVAYALYRQLPELVPGSYRILANLLSAGREK